MTLLNVWLTPGRALIGMDTAASVATDDCRITGHISKLMSLPHLGVVIASRGVVLVGDAFTQLVNQHGAFHFMESIDDVEPLLLQFASTAMESTHAAVKGSVLPFMRQTFVIVGWSPARHRMHATKLDTQLGASALVQEVMLEDGDEWSSFTANWCDDVQGECPDFSSVRAMLAFMREQIESGRRLNPGHAIGGGHMITAELDRHRIVLTRGPELD